MPVKLGAHMSIAGGCDRAVRAAHAVGFQTVQLFTKNNNQWKAPPLTDAHRAAFRAALAETGIVEPVVHNSYLINLGSPDDALWKKSIDAMTVEVERCEALGIDDLVTHPGAHVGQGEEAGLRPDRGGARRGPPPDPGDAGADRPGDDRGAGDLPRAPVRAPRARSSTGSPSRSGWASASTPAIFSRQGIPWRPRRSTMRRWMRWTGPSESAGSGSGTSTTAVASAGAGSIATPASAAGTWAWSRSAAFFSDPRFRSVPMILETPKGTEDGEDLDAVNLGVLRKLELGSSVTA